MKILLISNMFPSRKNVSFGTFVKTNHDDLVGLGYDVEKVVIDRCATNILFKLLIYMKFSFSFWFRLLSNNYNLIYVHYLTHTTIPLIPLLFLKGFKTDYVINIHGDDLVGGTRYHRFMSYFNHLLLDRAKLIVVPSLYFKDILKRDYPEIDSEKIFVSYSGGVKANFKPSSERKLTSDQEIRFGYLSRIEEGKGWQHLLDAISLLKDQKIDNCKFVFYGEGKELPILKKEISRKNLNNLVEYKGVVSHCDVPGIFNSLDFFVFPTERESLGLVLIESLACGTPVICSNIQPLNQVVNNDSLMLFEKESVTSLLAALMLAMQMPADKYEDKSTKSISSASRYRNSVLRKELGKRIDSLR